MTCSSCNQGSSQSVGQSVGEYDMFGAYAASTYLGQMKDGSPVYSVAVQDTAVNAFATTAIVLSGAALGWLLVGAVADFFVKNPTG